jgi:hypothetical protein
MITANRLSDGASVWMDGDGQWWTDITKGKWVAEAEAEALLKLAADGVKQCLIVGPYEIEVVVDGGITPVRFREQLRVKGPTIGLPT